MNFRAMIIIISKYLIPRGYIALAIFPFVIFSNKEYAFDPVIRNHEKIHLRQQAELILIFFYLWYITEYLIKLCIYKNRAKAYRDISFEKEAYKNEQILNYLKFRKLWSFIPYIKE